MKLLSDNNLRKLFKSSIFVLLLLVSFQGLVAADNTLNIAIGTVKSLNLDYDGRDPTLSDSQFPDDGGQCRHHRYTHFSPLITLDGDGNIIPWLAESFEVSGDYDSITFHLREGVKFSDGMPFNASVLKFNLDRIINYGWNDAYGDDGIKGANPIFVNYDFSEVIGDHTLEVHFDEGNLNLLQDFAGLWILGYFINPDDVVPVWDVEGSLNPEKSYNGLGAYYVDEDDSIPGEKVVLKKRSSWHEELNFYAPKMDEINFVVISDAQTRLWALTSGDVDYIYRYWNPPLESLLSLEDDSTVTIESRPSTMMYVISTSWWKEPFKGSDGITLRKAICYALDREEIVDGAFCGYALPATDSMYVSSSLAGVPGCCHEGYDFDPDKAEMLFKEAGWKDTDGDGVLDKDGQPLTLNLLITSSDSLDFSWQKDTALILQSQLMNMGVNVEIEDLEYSAYQDSRKKGEYDLTFRWSFPRYYSATKQLVNDFSLIGNLGYKNSYENQNGTLKEIVVNAQSATNGDEQQQYICQACQILHDEAGVVPVVYQKEFAVMNSKVKGFTFGSTEFLDPLDECWIEE